MVLEKVLSRALAERFGRYVRGLDSENLRVAAWKGEVKLHDLELVPDALSDAIDGPVRVVWGRVGHFYLSVPWSSLGSKPIEVVLDDVYALVSPVDTWGMDPAERKRRARYTKMLKVERKRKRAAALEAAGGNASSRGDGFLQKYVTKILDNIQITFRNIHIRYEDPLVNPGRTLCVGVTLAELKIQTTDDDWCAEAASAQGDRTTGVSSSTLFKLISLVDLALYCDVSGQSSLGEHAACGSSDIIREAFAMDFSTKKTSHDYIIFPTSATVQLSLSKSGRNAAGKAKVNWANVGAVLQGEQVASLAAMRHGLRNLEGWEAVYRHRPGSSPKTCPKVWWAYAIKAIQMANNSQHAPGKRRSQLDWLRVTQLLKKRKRYVILYLARANHSSTPSDYREFTTLEDELTASEIVAFQRVAEAELAASAEAIQPSEPGQASAQQMTWLGWALGRTASTVPTEEESASAVREEIMRVFSLIPDEGEEQYSSREDILGDAPVAPLTFDIGLNEMTLTLVHEKQPCFRLIWDTALHCERSGQGAWMAEASLGGLQAFDPQQKRSSTAVRTLIRGKRGATTRTIQVGDFQVAESGSLRLHWSNRTQGPGKELSVDLQVAAHEVVYSPLCFDRVREMLRASDMKPIVQAASMGVGGLSAYTTNSLVSALTVCTSSCPSSPISSPKRCPGVPSSPPPRINVTILVEAPLVILPDNPTDLRQSTLLMVDLGCITVGRDDLLKDDEHSPRWNLGLQGVQIVASKDAALLLDDIDPGAALLQTRPVVEKLDIGLTVTAEFEGSRLSGIFFEGSLPRLSFHVTTSVFRLIKRLIANRMNATAAAIMSGDAAFSLHPQRAKGSLGEGDTLLLLSSLAENDEEFDDDTLEKLETRRKVAAAAANAIGKLRVSGRFLAPLMLINLVHDGGDDSSGDEDRSNEGAANMGKLISAELRNLEISRQAQDGSWVALLEGLRIVDEMQRQGHAFSALVTCPVREPGVTGSVQEAPAALKLVLRPRIGFEAHIGLVAANWNPETISAVNNFVRNVGDIRQADGVAPPDTSVRNRGGSLGGVIRVKGAKLYFNRSCHEESIMALSVGSCAVTKNTDSWSVLVLDLYLKQGVGEKSMWPELLYIQRLECTPDPGRLRFSVNDVRAVYLHRAWLKAIDYITCGVVGNAVWRPWVSDEPSVSTRLDQPRSSFSLILDVFNADIHLPVGPSQRKGIKATIQHVNLTSPPPVEVKWSIAVERSQLFSFAADGYFPIQDDSVMDCALYLGVELGTVTLTGDLEGVRLALSQAQLGVVKALLLGNIGERKPEQPETNSDGTCTRIKYRFDQPHSDSPNSSIKVLIKARQVGLVALAGDGSGPRPQLSRFSCELLAWSMFRDTGSSKSTMSFDLQGANLAVDASGCENNADIGSVALLQTNTEVEQPALITLSQEVQSIWPREAVPGNAEHASVQMCDYSVSLCGGQLYFNRNLWSSLVAWVSQPWHYGDEPPGQSEQMMPKKCQRVRIMLKRSSFVVGEVPDGLFGASFTLTSDSLINSTPNDWIEKDSGSYATGLMKTKDVHESTSMAINCDVQEASVFALRLDREGCIPLAAFWSQHRHICSWQEEGSFRLVRSACGAVEIDLCASPTFSISATDAGLLASAIRRSASGEKQGQEKPPGSGVIVRWSGKSSIGLVDDSGLHFADNTAVPHSIVEISTAGGQVEVHPGKISAVLTGLYVRDTRCCGHLNALVSGGAEGVWQFRYVVSEGDNSVAIKLPPQVFLNWNPQALASISQFASALKICLASGRSRDDMRKSCLAVIEREQALIAEAVEYQKQQSGTGSGRPSPFEWAPLPQSLQIPPRINAESTLRLSISLGYVDIALNKEAEEATLLHLTCQSGGVLLDWKRNAQGRVSYVYDGELKVVELVDGRAPGGSLYATIVSSSSACFKFSSEWRAAGGDLRTHSFFSLSFKGVTRVVYVQPLWLEFLDYLFQGILGSAVWGWPLGKDGWTHVLEWSRSRFGARPSGTSEQEILVESPVAVMPFDCSSPAHIASTMSSLRFHSQSTEERIDGTGAILRADGMGEAVALLTMRHMTVAVPQFCLQAVDEDNKEFTLLHDTRLLVSTSAPSGWDSDELAQILEQTHGWRQGRLRSLSICLSLSSHNSEGPLKWTLDPTSLAIAKAALRDNLGVAGSHGQPQSTCERKVKCPTHVADLSVDSCQMCLTHFSHLYKMYYCLKCSRVLCRSCLGSGALAFNTNSGRIVKICASCAELAPVRQRSTVLFGYGGEGEGKLPISLSLEVPEVLFHLSAPSLGEDDGVQAEMLASNLAVSYVRSTSRDWRVDVSVGTVALTDTRSSAAHPHLIAPRGALVSSSATGLEARPPQVACAFSQSNRGNRARTLQVVLHHLEAIVAIGGLGQVLALLSYPACLPSDQPSTHDVLSLSLASASDILASPAWKWIRSASRSEPVPCPLHLRLTVYDLRALLLQNEAEVDTNALAFQGLLIFQYMKLVERVSHIQGSEGTVVTHQVTLQAQDVVSYVHAMSSSERHEDDSGIRVMDPIMLALDLTRTERHLRPPVLKISCAVESVATQISFGDLALVLSIINDWAQPRSARPSTQARALFSLDTNDSLYDVDFAGERLGLVLVKQAGLAIVDEADSSGIDGVRPALGDELVAVAGQNIVGRKYEDIIRLIRAQRRPLKLTFRRSAHHRPEAGVRDFVVLHARGSGLLDGVELAAGGLGQQAIVVAVERGWVPLPGIGATTQRKPHVGAIVIGVNHVVAEGMTVDMVEKLLEETPLPVRIRYREISSWPTCTLHAELSCANMRVTIVDDSEENDTDLIAIQVENLHVEAESGPGIGHKLAALNKSAGNSLALTGRLVGSTLIMADFYNQKAGLWEPLLESMGLDVGIERTLLLGPDYITAEEMMDLRVRASSEACLNVTVASLDVLLKLARGAEYIRKPAQAVRDSGSRYAPFILKNCTGLPIIFWVHEEKLQAAPRPQDTASAEGDRGAGLKPFHVEPGQDLPFALDQTGLYNDHAVRRGQDSLAASYITVRLDPCRTRGQSLASQALLNLPLQQVGFYLLEVEMGHEGDAMRRSGGSSSSKMVPTDLVWEVRLQGARRVLILRSALEVVNRTRLSLALKCSNSTFLRRNENVELQEEMLGVIPPGGRSFIPVEWSRVEDLRIMPFEPNHQHHEYSDCSLLVPAMHAGQETQGPVMSAVAWTRCNPIATLSSQRLPLFLFTESATIQMDEPATVLGRLGILDSVPNTLSIQVYAGLVLRNAMPDRVSFRVSSVKSAMPASSSANSPLVAEGELLAGESVDILEANALMSMTDVSFCLHGFDWTVRLRISPPGFSGDTDTVRRREVLTCANGAGQLLYLNMEIFAPRPNAMHVVIWTDFWVRNLSGLPVVVGEPVLALNPDGTLRDKRERSVFEFDGFSSLDSEDKGKMQFATTEVRLGPIQFSPVVEEVFEILILSKNTRSGGRRVSDPQHLWVSDLGAPSPPPLAVTLPDDRWVWEGQWEIDDTGGVNEDGWESCAKPGKGGDAYGSVHFKGLRQFKESDFVRRRRWTRRRHLQTENVDEDAAIPSMAYQPASSLMMSMESRHKSAVMSIKVNDSAWSHPLQIGVQGAGGPLQILGARWPHVGREDSRADSSFMSSFSRSPPQTAGKGIQTPQPLRLYELNYAVHAAPPPWHRTRVVTITSRYTVINRSRLAIGVKQVGAQEEIPLGPGRLRPLHWPDAHKDRALSMTIAAAEGVSYEWSGAVAIDNIGHFSVLVRCRQDHFSSSRDKGVGALTPWSHQALASSCTADDKGMPASKVVNVQVTFGSGDRGEGEDSGTTTSAVRIVLDEEGKGAVPGFRLENRTQSPIYYAQVTSTGPGDMLPPLSHCLFGWDEPCPLEAAMLRLRAAAQPLNSTAGIRCSQTLDIRKLGERAFVVADGGRLDIRVEPDGPTKVVRFDFSPHTAPSTSIASALGFQRRSVVASSASKVPLLKGESFGRISPLGSPRGSNNNLEALGAAHDQQEAVKKQLTAKLFLCGVRLSVVDPEGPAAVDVLGGRHHHHRSRKTGASGHDTKKAPSEGGLDGGGEMLLGCLSRVNLSFAAAGQEMNIRATIGSLQVDNFMPRSPFPVLLQPVSKADGGSTDHACEEEGGRPFLDVKAMVVTSVGRISYFKQLDVKMDDVDIRLDEGVVTWAQSFLDRLVTKLVNRGLSAAEWELEESWPLPPDALGAPHIPLDSGGRTVSKASLPLAGDAVAYLYIAALQVDRVNVRLSLQRPQQRPGEVAVGFRPAQMLLDMMMRMDKANISLSKFTMVHQTIGRQELLALGRAHYAREVRQHFLQILGSLEAFGNPVGLIRDMGQGMSDFVAEPVMGLMKSVDELRPEEFFAGIARGGGSLIKNTAGGVANSASMITGTIFDNLSALSLDGSYQRERARRAEVRGRPNDMLDGIGAGGVSIVTGISDGLSGVFLNPMKGAEREGLKGFAKGIGTGMIGLVVKPVVGFGDAATELLRGVKGTTDDIARIGVSVSAVSSGNAYFMRNGQVRPRRALYGQHRVMRAFKHDDARIAGILTSLSIKSNGTMFGRAEEGSAQQEEDTEAEYADHIDVGTSIVAFTLSRLVQIARDESILLSVKLDRISGVEVISRSDSRPRVVLHLRGSSNLASRAAAIASDAVELASAALFLPPPPSDKGQGMTKEIECVSEAQCRTLVTMIEKSFSTAKRSLWLL